MDVVSTAINAVVIAAVGLAVAWFGKGQVDALREHMDQRFTGVDQRFTGVDQRFDGLERRIDRLEERLDRRIDGLESRLDAMRSELTQVALAVGVRPRATNA